MFAYVDSDTDKSTCSKEYGRETWFLPANLNGCVGWLLMVLQINQISRTFTSSNTICKQHRGDGSQIKFITMGIKAYFLFRGK